MQRYIGTKVINAKPMTRGEYNALRGWTVPADENPADEGYLVEYTDGGTANVQGFAGYVSWSPSDVFARSYVHRPSREGLAPHQQRVVDEMAELDERMRKLGEFIAKSPIFKTLPADEQLRLENQWELMGAYYEILAARVDAF